MAINLELPRKMQAVTTKTHQGAAELMRPIARKYDLKEHAYPVELDTLISLFEGASESIEFAGANALGGEDEERDKNHNGANMAALLQTLEASWGDLAMMLSVPYQGLGNAAISAVANDEQLQRLGKVWAAMAITEPGFGSDSAAVSTTATLDGDEYVINGEKIFVTAGSRATHIVVWATLDKSKGRPAIKSFIVPRDHPGVTVERLEKSSASRVPTPRPSGSTTSASPRKTCSATRKSKRAKAFRGDGDLRQHPAHRCRHGRRGGPRRAGGDPQDPHRRRRGDLLRQTRARPEAAAAEFLRMEADWESAYLLSLRAAWQADNKIPNSKEASMSKAKAGRMATDVTLKTVELAGTAGYSEQSLLEKWARDSKILDIFEGTQQIQQLVVARRLLGLSSAELK